MRTPYSSYVSRKVACHVPPTRFHAPLRGTRTISWEPLRNSNQPKIMLLWKNYSLCWNGVFSRKATSSCTFSDQINGCRVISQLLKTNPAHIATRVSLHWHHKTSHVNNFEGNHNAPWFVFNTATSCWKLLTL